MRPRAGLVNYTVVTLDEVGTAERLTMTDISYDRKKKAKTNKTLET